jgi:thymidine kinase
MALTLILGPMKSGKSLELIARVAPYEFAKKKVIYVMSKKDKRPGGLSSRIGVDTKAIRVDSLKEINNGFDVIGIDEVFMFDNSDSKQIENWLAEGKDVVVSSLDLDYSATMMPMIKKLLELKPEKVINKMAVCEVCHKYKAQFTQILNKGIPVTRGLPYIVPEGASHNYEYQARCRNCHQRSPKRP